MIYLFMIKVKIQLEFVPYGIIYLFVIKLKIHWQVGWSFSLTDFEKSQVDAISATMYLTFVNAAMTAESCNFSDAPADRCHSTSERSCISFTLASTGNSTEKDFILITQHISK